MNEIIISPSTIKSFGLVSDTTNDEIITAEIKTVQDIELQNIIGTAMLNLLIKELEDKTLTEKMKFLYNNYIKFFMIYSVIAELIVDNSFQLKNIGVMSKNNNLDATNQAELSTLKYLKQSYKDKAGFYAIRIKNYITDNLDDFNEYKSTDDVVAKKTTYKTNLNI